MTQLVTFPTSGKPTYVASDQYQDRSVNWSATNDVRQIDIGDMENVLQGAENANKEEWEAWEACGRSNGLDKINKNGKMDDVDEIIK